MHIPLIRLDKRKDWRKASGSAGKYSIGGMAKSSSISTGKGSNSATSSGAGGGEATKISSGPLAGLTEGGETRGEVFGTRQYGKRYPGVYGHGVNGDNSANYTLDTAYLFNTSGVRKSSPCILDDSLRHSTVNLPIPRAPGGR
ncbi:hypothetical protein C8R44DRAFT_754406 [Mycena epipterygia]|nr:hypothetical protein C8R44DRAFT_754406 [Mycena epipterygia]